MTKDRPLISSANERLKVFYEEYGLTPEQIAEDEGMQLEAVELVLRKISPKYREIVGVKEKEDITDTDYDVIFEAYKNLALNAECEGVKERSLRFLIEEKKGRNDIRAKAMTVGQIDVKQLSICFEAAKRSKQKVLNKSTPKTIDVESLPVAIDS